jgi:hypothetical protein
MHPIMETDLLRSVAPSDGTSTSDVWWGLAALNRQSSDALASLFPVLYSFDCCVRVCVRVCVLFRCILRD